MTTLPSTRRPKPPFTPPDGPKDTHDHAAVVADLIESAGWGTAVAFLALLLAAYTVKRVIDIYMWKLDVHVNE